MVFAPLEIRIAFDHGHAGFKHEPLELTIAPGMTLLTFAPSKPELVWQYYLWTFGNVTPIGPTSAVYFVHWQEGVKGHVDPLVHSLLDFEYSIWANSTMANPHYVRIFNLTGAPQTLDLQLWMAEFPNRTAYLKWYCDLIIAGLRNNIGDVLLQIMKVTRPEFETILEDRRTKAYRPVTRFVEEVEQGAKKRG